jgi:hypothetical protein
MERFQEAQQLAQRALAIFERETEPEGIFVSTAQTTLGISYLGIGAIDRACPLLEQAALNRESHDREPARLGEVHFALARALAHGTDLQVRERSRALALQARAEYARAASSPAVKRAADEIAQWLDAAARLFNDEH